MIPVKEILEGNIVYNILHSFGEKGEGKERKKKYFIRNSIVIVLLPIVLNWLCKLTY